MNKITYQVEFVSSDSSNLSANFATLKEAREFARSNASDGIRTINIVKNLTSSQVLNSYEVKPQTLVVNSLVALATAPATERQAS